MRAPTPNTHVTHFLLARRLHAYIHDYLRKKGFRAAAEQFKIESKLPDVPGGEHPGGCPHSTARMRDTWLTR